MTISQQAAYVISNGTEYQARRASLYLRQQTPTTVAALGVLVRRVAQGR